MLLCSCEKDADINVGNSKALAVNSLITSDEYLTVNVSSSVPFVGSDKPNPVTDAEVRIYSNGELLDLIEKSTEDGNYISSIIPQEGHTYTVNVKCNGYNDAMATAILPISPKVEVLHVDPLAFTYGKDGYPEYSSNGMMTISIIDTTKALRYYMVEMNSSYKNPFGSNIHDYIVKIDLGNFYMNNTVSISNIFDYMTGSPDIEHETLNEYIIISNKNKKNDTILLNLHANIWSDFPIDLNVTSYTEDYYKYFASIHYLEEADEEVLFTEPVQVYNNVKNGYGLVAGLIMSSLTFRPVCDTIIN